MNRYHFECPNCKCSQLERILLNAVVSTKLYAYDNGEIRYICDDISDGFIDRFQCYKCGFVLQNGESNVETEEELLQWLKDQS